MKERQSPWFMRGEVRMAPRGVEVFETVCGLILSRDDQKSIEMLRELFFIQEDGKVNDDDDILDAFTENMLRVGDSRKKFAVGLDVLSLISRSVGYQRWSRTADVLLDCAMPNFFFDSKKQKMMVTTATTASAHEPQQQEQQPQQPQSEKVKVTEGEQILRILSSRVERAGEQQHQRTCE